jgi:hypothetical protein
MVGSASQSHSQAMQTAQAEGSTRVQLTHCTALLARSLTLAHCSVPLEIPKKKEQEEGARTRRHLGIPKLGKNPTTSAASSGLMPAVESDTIFADDPQTVGSEVEVKVSDLMPECILTCPSKDDPLCLACPGGEELKVEFNPSAAPCALTATLGDQITMVTTRSSPKKSRKARGGDDQDASPAK